MKKVMIAVAALFLIGCAQKAADCPVDVPTEASDVEKLDETSADVPESDVAAADVPESDVAAVSDVAPNSDVKETVQDVAPDEREGAQDASKLEVDPEVSETDAEAFTADVEPIVANFNGTCNDMTSTIFVYSQKTCNPDAESTPAELSNLETSAMILRVVLKANGTAVDAEDEVDEQLATIMTDVACLGYGFGYDPESIGSEELELVVADYFDNYFIVCK